MNKRIPVIVVTGFFGSGKSTLVKHMLDQVHDKRIEVVEYRGDTTHGDFARTLVELAGRRDEVDYVVIETNGIAHPEPLVQMFVLNSAIADAFELDGIVTTVDAGQLHLHFESKECREQVALADIILLNKLDLVEVEEFAALIATVRQLNRLAIIRKTDRSKVDLASILNQHAFMAAVRESVDRRIAQT